MRFLKTICNILTVAVLIKSSEPDTNKKKIVEARFQLLIFGWQGGWSLTTRCRSDCASVNLETLWRFIQMIQKLHLDQTGDQMNIKFKPIKNSERSWN